MSRACLQHLHRCIPHPVLCRLRLARRLDRREDDGKTERILDVCPDDAQVLQDETPERIDGVDHAIRESNGSSTVPILDFSCNGRGRSMQREPLPPLALPAHAQTGPHEVDFQGLVDQFP